MASSSYTVSIAAITKAAPADGFIDSNSVAAYQAKDTPTTPSSYDVSTTKQRANLRWRQLQYALSTLGNIYLSNITTPGGDANTAPSSIGFTATVEHGDSSLAVKDETNGGAYLYGVAALKRVMARALLANIVANQVVYDPTLSGTRGDSTQKVRLPDRVVSVTANAIAASLSEAEGAITITMN